MAGIEVRTFRGLCALKYVFSTKVDHRFPKSLGKACFPVGALIAMREIYKYESRTSNGHTYLIVNQSSRLSFIECPEFEAR